MLAGLGMAVLALSVPGLAGLTPLMAGGARAWRTEQPSPARAARLSIGVSGAHALIVMRRFRPGVGVRGHLRCGAAISPRSPLSETANRVSGEAALVLENCADMVALSSWGM